MINLSITFGDGYEILIVSDCNPPLLPPSSKVFISKMKFTFTFSDDFERISSRSWTSFNHDLACAIRHKLHLVNYFRVMQSKRDFLRIETS